MEFGLHLRGLLIELLQPNSKSRRIRTKSSTSSKLSTDSLEFQEPMSSTIATLNQVNRLLNRTRFGRKATMWKGISRLLCSCTFPTDSLMPTKYLSRFSISTGRTCFGFWFSFVFFKYFYLFYVILLEILDTSTYPLSQLVVHQRTDQLDGTARDQYSGMLRSCILTIEHPELVSHPESFPAATFGEADLAMPDRFYFITLRLDLNILDRTLA